MNIEIKAISNGWLVIVNVQGKGSSALYCETFEKVMSELAGMKAALDANTVPSAKAN